MRAGTEQAADDVRVEIDLGEDQLAQLTATRAALDASRRAWRNDILLSAVVEVLATRGPLTAELLLDGVNRMWQTTAVTAPQLDAAVAEAHAARLVDQVVGAFGEQRWQATDEAVRESREDGE